MMIKMMMMMMSAEFSYAGDSSQSITVWSTQTLSEQCNAMQCTIVHTRTCRMYSNLFQGNFFCTNCLCMYHLQQTQYYNVEAVWKCDAILIAKWYHTAIFVTFLRKRQQQGLDLMWAVTINWNAPWFAFPTLHNEHHKFYSAWSILHQTWNALIHTWYLSFRLQRQAFWIPNVTLKK